MRIYTKAGDLAFKTFTFPDGQPHFKLETIDDSGFTEVTIETSIKSPSELFSILIAAHTLRNCGFSTINLDVRYLLGARMDRSIGYGEPFSLQVVAQQINSAGFNRVRILDVHSDVATRLIRNSVNVLPFKVVEQVKRTVGEVAYIVPDKGARQRVVSLIAPTNNNVIFCSKKRDMATGALSGFGIADYNYECEPNVLIIDDICDGGGTFTGLAKELRAAGAKKVFLFCTHGVFSKGLPLDGVDQVFTTDSYTNPSAYENLVKGLIVIPISMKELAWTK